jgi:hypothetical protein
MKQLIPIVLLTITITTNAQVGIGTTTPDDSAILDVNSITQGFLPPRMTNVQRDAIVSPSDGLIIFNTTSGCPNYYFSGFWYEWCGTVVFPLGVIGALDCGSVNNIGTITEGEPTSGVSSEIPYINGNGGTHLGQTVTSTGVTGLTASLAAGTFASGTGTLNYTITGTPNVSGTASFALNIGGQTCTFAISVASNLAAQYPLASVFCASGPTAIVDVLNPTTGKLWMDRNLGASRAATNSTDTLAFGDLYQWGRKSDGHQCRNSSTTSSLSSTDQPDNNLFIITSTSPNDWRNPQNSNLWQGVNGINNPCPSGYRLPTDTELNVERLSWNQNNYLGAFDSPLKLPMTGYRSNSDGLLYDVANQGHLWSSSVSGINSLNLGSGQINARMFEDNRASGRAIRCIKD